tara:strand:+ start:347 stop:490 length:144 start_codon:yes stop_codon:yes gene_type:complete
MPHKEEKVITVAKKGSIVNIYFHVPDIIELKWNIVPIRKNIIENDIT